MTITEFEVAKRPRFGPELNEAARPIWEAALTWAASQIGSRGDEPRNSVNGHLR
jgi:hypothetical protein